MFCDQECISLFHFLLYHNKTRAYYRQVKFPQKRFKQLFRGISHMKVGKYTNTVLCSETEKMSLFCLLQILGGVSCSVVDFLIFFWPPNIAPQSSFVYISKTSDRIAHMESVRGSNIILRALNVFLFKIGKKNKRVNGMGLGIVK